MMYARQSVHAVDELPCAGVCVVCVCAFFVKLTAVRA